MLRVQLRGGSCAQFRDGEFRGGGGQLLGIKRDPVGNVKYGEWALRWKFEHAQLIVGAAFIAEYAKAF
jgi:hypothetical protein